ncbi:alanyl-tRNA editing protein [Deinococcus metallilatus]|uniref:Alanyl-tRNA editing protein n=1 Tax=Deinococcus metallilatus TaxID=1211322 RepID=A0AAJ5F5A8_9DEIO|nr:alanyl-tRNA editing protein [Deinococcus metallilatus]MBB5294218.1 alanyl-tRNA synthetase [Deinococcus metallilatus]QBY08997.1 alanyl-tRNA editing protein [Deinococcus metallilatus]RXJ10141.1 alanyl-tRNA editing protein [Deinococcus metallilatus]TLK27922.1 alanyl-tRNA editing protein [Deinococcus metallilatus]
MTRPLYHEASTLLTFTATVTDTRGGAVGLDATAFYPEGGGQNGDVGVLRWPGGEAVVRGTRKDKSSGVIWHEVGDVVPPVGTRVTGEVDAVWRWHNMARHSAEHLLAQAFHRVNPAFRVAAVSMRNAESTIDLEGDPTEADVRAAETLLRGTLARTDLELETPTVSDVELHRYPLRREAKVRGDVRLVIFRDAEGTPFDVSACGGTHVPRAALVAPVVVLRTERIRGGLTRVFFMAGEEAGAYLAGVYREARALAQGFSAPVEALPERVATLLADRDAQRAAAAALRQHLAHTLVRLAPCQDVNGVALREVTLDDVALLPLVLADVPPGEVVAALAPGGRCGIGSGREDVPAGELLGAALKVVGGKGGGRPTLAQGTTGQPDRFLPAVREALTVMRPAAGRPT